MKSEYSLSIARYCVGFGGSLVTTFGAYLIITQHMFDKTLSLVAIMALAVFQLILQLVFFLHVGRESRPRWNFTALIFAIVMISIIVVGSMWIMYNLNYNMMMTPEQMNQYMLKEGQKGF